MKKKKKNTNYNIPTSCQDLFVIAGYVNEAKRQNELYVFVGGIERTHSHF